MFLLFVACVSGSSAGREPIDLTYVDPDGEEWVADDVDVQAIRFVGADCAPGTWYQTLGGSPQLFAWFGHPDSGTLESDIFEVMWGSDDANSARYLQGGVGQLVQSGAGTLEYEITGGQDCTHPATPVDGESYVCADQAAPATFIFQGAVDELGVDEADGEAKGLDGSGAAVCGGDQPGG